MNESFAVLILSHGRPDNVITYAMLRKQGYTGRVYIIIDDEDTTAAQYVEKYGKQVITFSKRLIAKQFDECDNFDIPRKMVVYARNACFEIAKELGIQYFLQLDDDYQQIEYRFSHDLKSGYFGKAKNLDQLFDAVLQFYKTVPALTIAFAQGGDLLGGHDGGDLSRLWLKRKAMNSFFCCVDRPFKFLGRLNEDVNTYVTYGHRGQLIFTIYNADIVQTQTQSQDGGMTDYYLKYGTYVKSFYTVMINPSCVKIAEMGESHRRLHHKIDWPHAVPVIMNEKYRKA